MKLLIAGANRVDAGKTTFSVGLCHRVNATGYKPRAGNDFWFDHDDYRRSNSEGRLYGKDARRLAEASPDSPEPENINPVHRLWIPIPGRGRGLLGREGRAFVCDRVSVNAGGDWGHISSSGDRQEVNPSATHATHAYVVNDQINQPNSVRAALPLADAPRVSTLDAFNDIMADLHAPALAEVSERIDAADRAIVESYADVARPLQRFQPDAVAIVEPRRCRVYDGERYAKGCEVASGSAREGRLEERVANVLELLEPITSVQLPALPGEKRANPASIADAYESAYDELLAVGR